MAGSNWGRVKPAVLLGKRRRCAIAARGRVADLAALAREAGERGLGLYMPRQLGRVIQH